MIKRTSLKKVKKIKLNPKIILTILLNAFIFSNFSYAQNFTITTSKQKITLQEYFSVEFTFPKELEKEFKLYKQYIFPEITDFEKHNTEYLLIENEGFKITQYYKPRKTGNYTLPSISVKIKDQLYHQKDLDILVVKNNSTAGPTKSPTISSTNTDDFTENKVDFFLQTSTNKVKVYQGEGFALLLTLYIDMANKNEITYIDLLEQKKEILRKLKATPCHLEEPATYRQDFDTLIKNEKTYLGWNLFEATIYPNDSTKFIIPELPFTILTYATTTKKENAIERIPIYKKANASSIYIKILPIPSIVKINQLPIGNFKLVEQLSSSKLFTGKSFKYSFTITGEGNISSLSNPTVIPSIYFDFYTPKIKQDIVTVKGRTFGNKTFQYYVTPKEPGQIRLGNSLVWPFFNTTSGKLDTLKSNFVLNIRGESLKNNYISTNTTDPFYMKANNLDNTIKPIRSDNNLTFWINISILAMLIFTGIIVFKR